MNSNLPLNLNFDLDNFQQGALRARTAVLQLSNKMEEVVCEGDYEDCKPQLLAHRVRVISEIIENIGNFSEQQAGFISALLEYVEISLSGALYPEDWRPSAITGEWQ